MSDVGDVDLGAFGLVGGLLLLLWLLWLLFGGVCAFAPCISPGVM